MGRAKYPHLFSPLTAEGLALPNRVLAAALPAEPSLSAQELVDWYETLARGGFGGVVLPAELDPALCARIHEVVRDHGAVPLAENDGRLVWVEGLEAAAAAKSSGAGPVAAVCAMNDPRQAEEALSAGRCDLVALTGQQLADPDFVRKTLQDREAEIAPCLGCGGCQDAPGRCAANPRRGQELRWRWAPRPTGKRRVMVIGAGAAGLYAAATAAERGHDVILTETCRQPGGLLWTADVDERKGTLRRFRECLVARCRANGVKFHLGVTADGAYLDKMKPDAVICAVGGRPVRPEVPGAELTHHALFAYDKPAQVGRRVAILSAGGAGQETAEWLAAHGHEVRVMDRSEVSVTAVTPEGVRYLDAAGAEQLAPADTVLYDLGLRPDAAKVDALRAHSGLFFPVGSCAGADSLRECVAQGFHAAMDIL